MLIRMQASFPKLKIKTSILQMVTSLLFITKLKVPVSKDNNNSAALWELSNEVVLTSLHKINNEAPQKTLFWELSDSERLEIYES